MMDRGPSQIEIELLPRRTGDPLPEYDQHYRIRAETGWLLRGEPTALDDAAATLGGVSERIDDHLLLLAFGNAVGIFDVPGLGRIEVLSGKWNRADFDAMLAELTDIAVSLPFAATSTAAIPYDRTLAAQDDILYHMFVYIRHALAGSPANQRNLLTAFRHLLRDPHRRFSRSRRTVSLDQVRQLDPAALVSIASGTGSLTRLTSHQAARGSLGRALRGFAPDSVDEPHIEQSLDTPENRFAKAFLGSIDSVIGAMREAAARPGSNAFATRVAQECDALDALLKPIKQHPLWREVGTMVHLPASSTVLQRGRGYRDLYYHFSRMRLAARVPLDQDIVHDLLGAKDIAQLYEIWAYFALVRQISAVVGQPVRAGSPRIDELQVTVPWDLECVWENGVTLTYNPRFSRSDARRYSFSVPLRPDVALLIPHGPNAGLHLLDAKFKVDRLSDVMPLTEESGATEAAEDEERRGTFRRGDLYKMHAYRDAIPAARSVWILYPGSDVRFFAASGESAVDADTLPNMLDGVGAIPLLPMASSHAALHSLLARLLGS